MNKADLKQRWGKYTDTDKLVDDIQKLLIESRFRNSEHGICTMLDTYFTNKEPLIELLQKSDNYVGDMRIVTTQEFEREKDNNVIYNTCYSFPRNIDASNIILQKEDEHGKTIMDYLVTGVTHFQANELENKAFFQKFVNMSSDWQQFTNDGYTKDSDDKYRRFIALIDLFKSIYTSMLNERNVNDILKQDNTLKVTAGMKTSRAFNHICNVYGVDKAENYNKLFAQYADMVSGLKRKLKFVISVNPYDYLAMSIGKSWTSCHNIKAHGGWCGGTLSYMLDGTSIITYCVEKDDDVQTAGKIYRNMFAFGNNMLLQSRVYPQGNDGNTDLYAVFRKLVQNELSAILELSDNDWFVAMGPEFCRNATTSHGVHYKDYHTNRNCNISYPIDKANEVNLDNHSLVVGHNGICAYCGQEITNSCTVSHSNCSPDGNYDTLDW